MVLQRLHENGFDGKITIVRDYLRHLRGPRKKRQAFLRFESLPGEQMQIDWGHFGSLLYAETKRKLYALVVLEAYSRMLYVRIYPQPEPIGAASVPFKCLHLLWWIP